MLDNPRGVSAIPSSGKVGLSWAPSQPAEYVKYYSIYVATSDFASVEGMTPRLNVAGTSATVAGLTNDVPYFFAVTAVNLSGCETPVVTAVAATPVPDRLGPVVSDLKLGGLPLANGMTVKTSGILTLSATDASGMSRVEFSLDGAIFAVDTNGSTRYSALLNILPLTDGNHDLVMVAYDTLGNRTSVSFTLNIELALPLAPAITSPTFGVLVNTPTITVSGRAEANFEVLLYINSIQKGASTVVDGKGNFSMALTLVEGENRIQAAARNRAGTGPKSAEVLVTLDTTLPQKPTGLSAQSGAGGAINLAWRSPVEKSLKGFHLYRAAQPFNAPGEAVRITSSPVAGAAFRDLPAADGTYIYRVSTVDQAGNESGLSEAASAISDRTAPFATAIQYVPSGPYDPATGRMAPGTVAVHLTVSEPQSFIPFLSITPQGGLPLAVDLSRTADIEYSGWFAISETTPSGTAYAVFSGRDQVGNRGTEIALGGSLEIDTAGPAITQIVVQPKQPIKNDQQNPVQVSFMIGLNEAVKPGTVPEVSYLLSGQGRNPTRVSTLARTSAQPGHAQTWLGSLMLPADAGRKEVENLQFVYRSMDDLGNIGTRVLCDNRFQVYQGDLPPLDAPQGLTGKALSGGRIKLNWKAVSGAVGYQLYRKGPGEAELLPHQRFGVVLSFTDQAAADGVYGYAIASIRRENDQEAVSAMSAPIQVTSDSIAPLAPQNLKLQLIGQGILAGWEAPPGVDPVTYALYRADANEITSVAGLSPIIRGIRGVQALDAKPSLTDHCYVVTAVDEAGNESPPSNSFYLNFTLLPVSSLKVVQDGTESPGDFLDPSGRGHCRVHPESRPGEAPSRTAYRAFLHRYGLHRR